MSHEMTLQQLLTERVSAFAAGDRPREIIDEHIQKMFKDVVSDCFRSYGDLGKAVSEAIRAAMPGNVADMFELTRYNALIENALRAQWESSGVEADMVRRAQECMSQALAETALPSVISLEALLQEFATANREQAANNQWEAPEVRIEESEYGGVHIFFDVEPESAHSRGSLSLRSSSRHNYALKNRILTSIDRAPELDQKGNRLTTVWHAQIDGDPIGRSFRIHSKWERMLAALYFGGAKLAIDCDADDISYGIYD